MSVSVVVPVYRSQATLPELTARLDSVLRGLGCDYEIIYVNDGSPDESWRVVEELAAKFDHVAGMNLARNFGQHNALLAGIRRVRHDVIITMDDDLQNPPEEIPRLLAELEGNGHDVVYGVSSSLGHERWRIVSSLLTKWALSTFMGAETAKTVTTFRAIRTPVRDAFESYRGSFVSIDVLLTWGTTRFGSIAVSHHPRMQGSSTYTFRKLVTQALNMVTGFSTLPLQIASYIGFAFTLFGLGVLAFVVGRYFWSGASVAGFAFLASIIAIFSGAQLFALGIIGEYLARMHFRIMDKPSYTVRAEIGRSAEAGDDRA